jgi:hypothetical protein
MRGFGAGWRGLSLANRTKITRVEKSGMRAKLKTVCQPHHSAKRGPKNVARAVPLLPAPAIPMAMPCR